MSAQPLRRAGNFPSVTTIAAASAVPNQLAELIMASSYASTASLCCGRTDGVSLCCGWEGGWDDDDGDEDEEDAADDDTGDDVADEEGAARIL